MAVNGVEEEDELCKGVIGQDYRNLALSRSRANAPADREQSDLTQEWLYTFVSRRIELLSPGMRKAGNKDHKSSFGHSECAASIKHSCQEARQQAIFFPADLMVIWSSSREEMEIIGGTSFLNLHKYYEHLLTRRSDDPSSSTFFGSASVPRAVLGTINT